MDATLDDRSGAGQAIFSGVLLMPDDDEYDAARKVWNGEIDRRPALIARCANPADVVAAIALARQRGLEISVRGGAHNFAGYAVCDGGLMIDLSPMRDVVVDATNRRAVCGGGATWADLDGATQAHGLAVTGGFISHTGVAGLTLGGGLGWLMRKAGLTIDSLVSVELVTSDGRVVTASEEQNPDLFWAVRGGGGNFGVVTTFEFRLHDVGPLVNLGLFFWGADQGTKALRFSRDFIKTLPDDTGVLIGGLSAPPAPFVPEQFQLATGIALVITTWGSPEEHAGLIAPIRQALPPSFELVAPMPYVNLQQMFDEGNPFGILGYEKALYLDELSDAAIAVIAEYVPKKASPLSFVPIFVMGGACRTVGDAETAFGGSRSAGFAVNIAALAPSPELLVPDRAWVRTFWDALRPLASNAGGYVNFMTEYDEDRVRASYGTKYERLAQLKAEWDPDNVFHFNANIRPAT